MTSSGFWGFFMPESKKETSNEYQGLYQKINVLKQSITDKTAEREKVQLSHDDIMKKIQSKEDEYKQLQKEKDNFGSQLKQHVCNFMGELSNILSSLSLKKDTEDIVTSSQDIGKIIHKFQTIPNQKEEPLQENEFCSLGEYYQITKKQEICVKQIADDNAIAQPIMERLNVLANEITSLGKQIGLIEKFLADIQGSNV